MDIPLRRPWRWLIAIGLAWAATSAGNAAPAAEPAAEGDTVIVKFKAGAATLRRHALAERADAAEVRAVLGRRADALGARARRSLEAGSAAGPRVQVVRARGMSAAALAALLRADAEVEYAVPSRSMRAMAAPNDPLYLSGPALAGASGGPVVGQWYLRAPDATVASSIDVEPAWALTQGDPGVVVAVLDTGVLFDHPDLGRVANGGKLLPGYDFITDSVLAGDGGGRDTDPTDPGTYVSQADLNADNAPGHTRQLSGCSGATSSWHGTATASLIGAATNNGIGMAGVAPNVLLLPLRVLGKCGKGDSADIQAAMRWAVGIDVPGVPKNLNPAKVLNMSLGSECVVGQPCTCDQGDQDAVNDVLAKGAVVVAAAGNNSAGGGPVGSPANCRGVIAVAAIRHVGTKVGFSDLGPEVTVSAPGGNCVNVDGSGCLYPIIAATNAGTTVASQSTWFDSFRYEVGTSFSAPLVAGVAALMYSRQPGLTPDAVSAAIKSSARPFPTSGAGNGVDGLPVPQCFVPSVGSHQDQCYCTTSTCGAGMLDAGAAVAAASGPLARIDISPATAVAGTPVSLSGAGSSAATGRQIAAFAWSIVAAGGIVNGFSSAVNASTATLTPSAAGSFTVQLKVTDNLGASASTSRVVTVSAAPAPDPTPTPTPTPVASSGGGGGGAFTPAWALGLLLAALVLSASRRP